MTILTTWLKFKSNVLLESIAISTRRQELHAERAVMARMGFLDKINELDVIIEEKRVRLKKVRAPATETPRMTYSRHKR